MIAEEIVRELADQPAPITEDVLGSPFCLFCDSTDIRLGRLTSDGDDAVEAHEEGCAWRLATEWVRDNPVRSSIAPAEADIKALRMRPPALPDSTCANCGAERGPEADHVAISMGACEIVETGEPVG